jgi:hypothetical protein
LITSQSRFKRGGFNGRSTRTPGFRGFLKGLIMLTYFHGTDQPEVVMNALIGNGELRLPFHLTHDPEVARCYGCAVVCVQLESDIEGAHVGLINKEGNCNRFTGHSVETVCRTPKAMNSLYAHLFDASRVI